MDEQPRIELVCAGRLCVDIYAEQDGADLDHADSFRRYLGGSAGNICFGAARLGVRTAMLARIGDDQNGGFLRRAMLGAGVNVAMVHPDPTRLTPLVMLAIRPSDDFPRLFHYTDSADMATAPEDIDIELLSTVGAVLITGSFLANEAVRATTHRLIELARAAGSRIVLDIDYRPVLWGLSAAADGHNMLVMSQPVTDRLAEVLPFCDLVVGTGEEIRIAGGTTDIAASLMAIRRVTEATIVMKVGAQGCHVIEGPIPTDIESSPPVSGFPVEVVNTVGAGDGFFAGFLSGWLRGRPAAACARLGNAVGAIVVSRHGCSVAMPTDAELTEFLGRDQHPRRPGDDVRLAQLHRRATDPRTTDDVLVLAIDHRWQMEALAREHGADHERIAPLKALLFEAFIQVRDHCPQAGLLVDDLYGRDLLERACGQGWWLARALDVPLSRPVEFTCGDEVGLTLRSWPSDQIAKLMVYAHPDDPPEIGEPQWRRVAHLAAAAARAERRYLIEFQSPSGVEPGADYLPRLLSEAYGRGVTPDWWKLPPLSEPDQWRRAAEVIAANDPTCHGMLVLGQTSSPAQLSAGLTAAAGEPLVRGFAIGRAIFAEAASRWFAGTLDDVGLVADVAARYRSTIDTWKALRP